MAYLQLAENNGDYNMLAEGSVLNNYLTIPPGFMGNNETKFVRLDYFDNLPDEQFALTMAKLAPYQPVTLLSAGGENLIKVASFGANFIPGVGPLVSKVVEKAGPMAVGLVGKKNARKKAKKGTKDTETDTEQKEKKSFTLPNIDASVNVGGQELGLTYNKPGNEPTTNFFSKYKIPIIVGSVALIGGYFLLNKKK